MSAYGGFATGDIGIVKGPTTNPLGDRAAERVSVAICINQIFVKKLCEG